jgi:hypothetical protein
MSDDPTYAHVTTEMPDGSVARIDATEDHLVVLAKGKLCVVGRIQAHRAPWLTAKQALELAAQLQRVAGPAGS